MEYPILTQRLRIEPLALAHLDTFVTYRQDPEIARFQSWETTYSKDQALELIDSQAGVLVPNKGQWLQLAIHIVVSGEHAGDIAIHSVQEEDSTFELGFTIASRYQGQGFAKEAATGLMNHLVSQARAKKFIATTDSRNTASIKVLTALGFMQDDSKSWTETFKGEPVTVDYFETSLMVSK